MPGTRGTRRGNGAGWGGPAKGAGHRMTAADPVSEAARAKAATVAPGTGKKAQARAALEDAAPLAVQTVIDLATKQEDPRALAAALAVLNRIGLHEKSGVEHTGADGGPMQVAVRKFFQPPE